MPDYFDIYQNHAVEYDLLVEREDHQHHLFQALDQLMPLKGLDVVEFGAGTGRLTCLLAPLVRSIRAFDSSQAMLDVAVEKLNKTGWENWQVEIGDHRQVAAESASADMALSGWSLCYLALEKDTNWQAELNRGLAEMERVLRKDGTLVVLETLGTGHETPEPPSDLQDYFAFLEARGFQRSWIRTDYRFHDLQEARTLTRFFFGEAMLQKIETRPEGILLPECTGLWSM